MQSHSASVGQTAGVHIQQNSIGVNAVTGVQVPGNTVILKMNDIAPPISTVGKIKIKWIHMDIILKSSAPAVSLRILYTFLMQPSCLMVLK